MRIETKLICFALLLSVGCGGDFGEGKHIQGPATVIATGETSGGNCFTCGNPTTPIKVRWADGREEYAQTWDRLMVGQKVYRECWMKDGESQCFLNFTRSPRSMYKKGI